MHLGSVFAFDFNNGASGSSVLVGKTPDSAEDAFRIKLARPFGLWFKKGLELFSAKVVHFALNYYQEVHSLDITKLIAHFAGRANAMYAPLMGAWEAR